MTNTNYPSATPNPQPRGSNNKGIIIGVLAAALLGTWGYWLYKNNQSSQEITTHETKETAYMSARDSVQMLYNDALSRLDSITGNNNNLHCQLKDKTTEISKLKTEINSILKKKNNEKNKSQYLRYPHVTPSQPSTHVHSNVPTN